MHNFFMQCDEMYLLKNGFVVDPENNLYGKMDILIGENKKIIEVAPKIFKGQNVSKEYNLEGKTVFPGFIDMHVHLREPGREDKETIETGLKAALAGGFTGVGAMPNTNPVCDNRVIVEFVKNTAEKLNLAKVYVIGAASKGEKGEELSCIGEMHEAGIIAISDDGKPVTNSLLMRRVFEYIRRFDLTFICHAEDEFLSKDGVINEGEYSIKLGMKGIPDEAESIMVGRDILLCEMTKSKLHIAHVSTEGSMILIEGAKKRGVDVTVEITPHHFTLTDEEVEKQAYSTNTKVNPPLRNAKNRDKMLEYIKRGLIDMIVTDHAPHTKVDKTVEYDYAPFGMTGLETAVGLVVTNLVKKDIIDMKKMAEMMSINPRKRFKIEGGIKKGNIADLSIIDMDKEWVVEKEEFYSKGKNTPFQGIKLTGKPYMTIVDGMVKMYNGNIL